MIYLRARSLFRKDSKTPERKASGKKPSTINVANNDVSKPMTYNNHDTGVANDSMQRALLFRCLAVLIAFFAFYPPSFLVYFNEVVAGPFPSRKFAFFASMMVALDCNVSPLLFIYLNHEYRRAIKTFIFDCNRRRCKIESFVCYTAGRSLTHSKRAGGLGSHRRNEFLWAGRRHDLCNIVVHQGLSILAIWRGSVSNTRRSYNCLDRHGLYRPLCSCRGTIPSLRIES